MFQTILSGERESMASTVADRFYENNEMIFESPLGCDLKVGDVPSLMILGFRLQISK